MFWLSQDSEQTGKCDSTPTHIYKINIIKAIIPPVSTMAVRQFCRKPNWGCLLPTEFMSMRALAPDPRQDDRFMRQKLAVSKELYQQDLKGHYGCVNAIEFSNGEGDYIASGLFI